MALEAATMTVTLKLTNEQARLLLVAARNLEDDATDYFGTKADTYLKALDALEQAMDPRTPGRPK